MTITFYNWTVLPPIFTGMYECLFLFHKRRQPTSPLATPFAGSNTMRFLLWGFVEDSVYIPPLPMSLKELRERITHALQTITADMLHRVWDEFDYSVDVCRVTQGAHIEEL